MPEIEVLIECGFSQSNSLERDYIENNAKFSFSCKKIKYIFVGHCHLDHIGRIPLLYKRGCNAKIIVPEGSIEIIRNMLEDSAKILERDALLLTKQKHHEYDPIYNLEDVELALSHLQEYSIKELWELDDTISFQFIPSGHIRRACQIELYFRYNNVKKKLVYTSDLGNPLLPKRFAEPFEPIEKCDIFIGECTYADATRIAATPKLRQTDLEKIASVIQTHCIDMHAKILVPCFALDRTPEMYMTIREVMKQHEWDIPILIDSPLAVKQFKIYAKDNPKLMEEVERSRTRLCVDWSESTQYHKANGPMIIISSSGMLTAGRVLQYLPHILPDSRNCILFCGYSTEGTLAWDIKKGQKKTLKIGGKRIPNCATIVSLNSFSSHMQHDELLEYYSNIQCNKIYLVHGQQKEKVKFAQELRERIAEKVKTTQVICANKSSEGRL